MPMCRKLFTYLGVALFRRVLIHFLKLQCLISLRQIISAEMSVK